MFANTLPTAPYTLIFSSTDKSTLNRAQLVGQQGDTSQLGSGGTGSNGTEGAKHKRSASLGGSSISSMASSSSIRRDYDATVHSFCYYLSGDSHTTKIMLPKSHSTTLHLQQSCLVIQCYVGSSAPFYIEVVVGDSRGSRRRLVFSTAFKQVGGSALHLQIPLGGIERDKWINLALDLQSLAVMMPQSTEYDALGRRVSTAQQQKRGTVTVAPFHVIHSVTVAANCRLRRVFTLPDIPADTSADIELYGEECLDSVGTADIPAAVNFPANVQHVSQIIDANKVEAYVRSLQGGQVSKHGANGRTPSRKQTVSRPGTAQPSASRRASVSLTGVPSYMQPLTRPSTAMTPTHARTPTAPATPSSAAAGGRSAIRRSSVASISEMGNSSAATTAAERREAAQKKHLDRLKAYRQSSAQTAQNNAVDSIFSSASEQIVLQNHYHVESGDGSKPSSRRSSQRGPPISKSAFTAASSKSITKQSASSSRPSTPERQPSLRMRGAAPTSASSSKAPSNTASRRQSYQAADANGHERPASQSTSRRRTAAEPMRQQPQPPAGPTSSQPFKRSSRQKHPDADDEQKYPTEQQLDIHVDDDDDSPLSPIIVRHHANGGRHDAEVLDTENGHHDVSLLDDFTSFDIAGPERPRAQASKHRQHRLQVDSGYGDDSHQIDYDRQPSPPPSSSNRPSTAVYRSQNLARNFLSPKQPTSIRSPTNQNHRRASTAYNSASNSRPTSSRNNMSKQFTEWHATPNNRQKRSNHRASYSADDVCNDGLVEMDETTSDTSVLQYDPILECYYNPETQRYYKMAT